MRMLGEKGASGGIFGAVREDGRRKGVVRQALQTLCSGEHHKSPGTFPVKKKKQGFCSSEQRTAPLVRFAHRRSKMSSTEATPEHMVVVQHKEITSSYSNNYYCVYYNDTVTLFNKSSCITSSIHFHQILFVLHKQIRNKTNIVLL